MDMMPPSMSPSARCAEGFYCGLKLAVVHAITVAPFWAKGRSFETGRSFRLEYSFHCLRALGGYAGVLSAAFGMR